MTPTEAVVLCRAAAAMCPSQHFDEYTPDAWFAVLDDVDPMEAHRALKALGKVRTFIAPSDIRTEVKRVRRDRLDRADVSQIQPPSYIGAIENPEDQDRAYRAWLKDTRERIASGELDVPDVIQPAIQQQRPRRGIQSLGSALPDHLTRPSDEETA